MFIKEHFELLPISNSSQNLEALNGNSGFNVMQTFFLFASIIASKMLAKFSK